MNNVTVRDCILQEFDQGVQFADVSGGSVLNNFAFINRLYGVDLTRATDISVTGNSVVENGDEGIHVTGKVRSGTPPVLICPTPHPGRNIVADNQIGETAGDGEAVYILCSDSNRIEANATYLNNGPGVFIDETSTGNLVRANYFDNDGVTIRLSDNNSIVENTIADDASVVSPPARLVYDGGQSNYAERNYYVGDSSTPDACVRFESQNPPSGPTRTANCNQDVRSDCAAPENASIDSDAAANVNNRLFRFGPAAGVPVCGLGGSASTVDVYNDAQTLIGCDTSPEVNDAACSWWAFDELCDDGTTGTLGGAQSNASNWNLNSQTISTTQYYRANLGAIELSSTLPITVSSAGCLSMAAATIVKLHPGTTIEGRLRATVW